MTDGCRYVNIVVIGRRLLECCFEVVGNWNQIIGLIVSWSACLGDEYQEEGHYYNEEEEHCLMWVVGCGLWEVFLWDNNFFTICPPTKSIVPSCAHQRQVIKTREFEQHTITNNNFNTMFSWSKPSSIPPSAASSSPQRRSSTSISRDTHLASYLNHPVLKPSTRKVSVGEKLRMYSA